MSSRQAFFASVDRIEGRIVVLISDDGVSHEVTREELGPHVEEGTILHVSVDAKGSPLWKDAKVDPAEQKRRTDARRKQWDDLTKNDPGGEIQL